MANQGPGPGAATGAVGVAIATAITSVIIAKLSGKLADMISGDPKDADERMYDEIHGKIGKASFQISSPTSKVASRKIKIVMDQPSTMAFVKGAIEQLEKAEKSTNCGVCKKKLLAAKQAVITEAKVIGTSDAKYQVMKDLKKAGKIPTNAKWNQLSHEQKNFINKIVEKGV